MAVPDLRLIRVVEPMRLGGQAKYDLFEFGMSLAQCRLLFHCNNVAAACPVWWYGFKQ